MKLNYDIYHGDCLEEMKKIPDGSVDLILTDPPYGTTACKWDHVIPFEPMWVQVWRVLKPNGACCLFGSEPFSSALRMSQIKHFKYDWIWHKNMGSGIALAKKRPMKNHEILSVFYKNQPNYYPIFEKYADSVYKRFNGDVAKVNKIKSIARGESNNIEGLAYIEPTLELKRGKYPTTVKFFKIPNRSNGQRFHHTQKPVDLLEYLIKTYTLEGETVLDFTMGSGSTGVACVNTNRKFIGIEKEKKYFEIASKRINDAVKDKKANLFQEA